MPRKLDAREYKMLLKDGLFSKTPSKTDVRAFWSNHLAPFIEKTLGDGAEGSFDDKERRQVVFRDTADCLLSRFDLALRLRSPRDSVDDSHQLTLKLRMPDYFVVAATDLPGKGGKVKTSFEEDIAPLGVEKPGASAQPFILSVKRSIRSRFALSTKIKFENAPDIGTPDALLRYFPTLADILDPELEARRNQPLLAGPLIEEFVFEGPRVVLSKGTKGEFSLTNWNFGEDSGRPPIAEISFRCETPDGEMSGRAARAALKLFTSMQATEWVSREHSSKTALALPGKCGE